MLIVSGRPQLIGDRLGDIDALVASWLPGTEGDGVADVLYGKRAFTGQLPVTWPKSQAQLPVNVGDKAYDPQYPYGWGLTTLTKPPSGGELTLKAIALSAKILEAAGRADSITEALAKPFAEADHLLLSGDLTGAVAKLTAAYRLA